jgi:hypothetical protein
VNLFGWDTASTLSLDAMNPRFGAATASDTSFSTSIGSITLRGQFGPWAIERGGSGQYVNIAIPLTAGSLGGPQPADFHDITVHLEAVLRFNSVDNGAQALALHLGQYVEEGGSDPSIGPVYLLGVDDPAKQLNALQRPLLGKLVAHMLVANAHAYEHVFATSGLLGTGTPDWLVPSALAYVYTDGRQGGWVTIVAATYRRDVSGLQAAVDEALVAGDGNAAIAISGGLFLRYVLMPLLPAAFTLAGSAPSFGWNGIEMRVESMGSIPAGKTHYGLIDYYPQVDSIHVSLVGETLTTQIAGSCDLYMGIGLTYTVALQHHAVFQPKTGTLALVSAGPPASNHSVTGAGAMVPGIAGLIALIVGGIATWIGSAVSSSLSGSLGDLTITRVPPLSVQWSGVSDFTITAAGLDDGLWMRGTVG